MFRKMEGGFPWFEMNRSGQPSLLKSNDEAPNVGVSLDIPYRAVAFSRMIFPTEISSSVVPRVEFLEISNTSRRNAASLKHFIDLSFHLLEEGSELNPSF